MNVTREHLTNQAEPGNTYFQRGKPLLAYSASHRKVYVKGKSRHTGDHNVYIPLDRKKRSFRVTVREE